jgi:hypothetical protein
VWYLGRVQSGRGPRHHATAATCARGGGSWPPSCGAQTGGWRDRKSPAPVAYGLHIIDAAHDVDTVRVTRTTVRRGRTMGFSRSEIVDAADPGRALRHHGIGVTLGDAPRIRAHRSAPRASIPTTFALAMSQRNQGRLATPDSTRAVLTSASLHIGPVHIAFEAAAITTTVAGTNMLQAENWDVHFIAPGSARFSWAPALHRPRPAVRPTTLVDEDETKVTPPAPLRSASMTRTARRASAVTSAPQSAAMCRRRPRLIR